MVHSKMGTYVRDEGVWRTDMFVDNGEDEGERPGLDQRELDLGRPLGTAPPERPDVSIAIG